MKITITRLQIIAVAVLAMAAVAQADIYTWIGLGPDNDWFTNLNWLYPSGIGTPSGANEAHINSGTSESEPVIYAGPDISISGIVLGNSDGDEGHLRIQNGNMYNPGGHQNLTVGNNGKGWLQMTGGVVTPVRDLMVGEGGTGSGIFLLNGGEFRSFWGGFIVGDSGEGHYLQNGGLFYVNGTHPSYIGKSAGGFGSVVIENGSIQAVAGTTELYIGDGGEGEMHVNGGAVSIARDIYIGNQSGSKGKLVIGDEGVLKNNLPYGMTFGVQNGSYGAAYFGTNTVYAGGNSSFTIGRSGTGYVELHGTKIFVEGWTARTTVRENADGAGVLRGWGEVDTRYSFDNNGLVIADGFGGDRELLFTNNEREEFYVGNTIPNTSTNGWYARNGGKLVLPGIRVPSRQDPVD
ncbi:MAG: hypothetical protein FWG05_03755, partial [Kiritimatiellaeota bacterium]|nr:hypothetical protein [Kiritimatiellota bacterium]